MVFVPTPRLLLDEELERGVVLAINCKGDPVPDALIQRFLDVGGSAGAVVFEGEICACWRFMNLSTESEYATTRRVIEQLLQHFRELRGEDLCLLDGEPPEDIQNDMAAYTGWYVGELRRRENILNEEEKIADSYWKNYDELRAVQRALYRAANRHPEVEWWENYQRLGHETQLRTGWKEEREHESAFVDMEFATRKAASGLRIGGVVKTLVVPKEARIIPVPIGTVGCIAAMTDLYWMVTFSLPLTDCDGRTWQPYDEKTTVTIGYLTEELSLSPR